MSAKKYLAILKWGASLAPLVLLLVFPPILFPYITSKQLTFNILMEVLLFFWLLLVTKYPAYRPKKSWLTYGLLAYFGVVLLSAVVGVDFNLSFFGNAERMLGWFHLFHFFIFYLLIITAWRDKKDWLRFLDICLGVSVIIVLYGIKQNYPASFLGNAAYTAALLLFALGFAIYQINQKWAQQVGRIKLFGPDYLWAYFLSLPILFYGLLKANISGAYVGLLCGILAALFLWAVLSKNKTRRMMGAGAMILVVVLVGILFAGRNTVWLKNSQVGVALKDFSSSNPTWNTRLISWRAAYLDFKTHPILGVGHGNYAFVFDYYFEPRFLDYSPNETYFDRAHNNLVDIASTTGALGLIAYLSIFAALVYYLALAYRQKKIKLGELVVLSGIFVAYFIQNLALFDALVTYMMFFSLLGLVYFYNQNQTTEEVIVAKINKTKEYFCGVIISILLAVVIWTMNINGFIMFNGAIKGYSAISQGETALGLSYYENSLNLAPYNRDSRSTLVNLITGNPQLFSALDQNSGSKLLAYGVSLGEQNVAYNPYDSMMNSQLARLANFAARYSYRDTAKLNKYSAIAVNAIEQAIASSPKRYPLYFTRSDVYLTRGDKEEALGSLSKILELKPDNKEVNCQLANVHFFFEDYEESYGYAAQCALDDRAQYLSYQDLIKQAADYQLKKGNKAAADKLRESLAE